MKRRLTIAYVLSILSVIPLILRSFAPFIYERMHGTLRDIYPLFRMVAADQYQRLINIAVLAILIVSLIYSIRGSYRGRLIWLGCVFYFVYVQIVFSFEQLLFYLQGNNVESLWRGFFEQSSVYFFPFFLSLAAFIIGLTSLKEIEIENKTKYDKLARMTAVVFIVYLTLIVSHLIFWLRINILIYLRGGEPLYAGGQDLVNMITIIPFFTLVVIILIKRRELGGIIAPIALFPVAIPVIHSELLDSFGLNVFKMISNLVSYIHRCVFRNLAVYIEAYMNDDPRKSISRIFPTTDHFLDEIRLVFLICSAVLIVLFLKNIKETPKR